jgi:MFS family permease
MMATTTAYVADCTPLERRVVSFAYIQSVLFTGIALGPVIGGIIINRTGSVAALFYCALAIHFSFAFCVIFLLPESVTPENMSEASRNHHARRLSVHGVPYTPREWQYWGNIFNIFQPLTIFWPSGHGPIFRLKRRNMVILAIVDGILLLNIGAIAVILLYPIYMFNWGDLEVHDKII